MIRKFIRDGLFYSLMTLLSRGISFLLLPLYTHVLSPDDYGVIDMLMLLGAIMNLVVALEVMQGLARYLPESKNPEEKRVLLSSALWFTVITYAISGILLLIFDTPLNRLLLDEDRWLNVYHVAIITLTLNGIFLFFQNALRWQVRAKQSGLVGLFYSLGTAFFTLIFVIFLKQGLFGVFYGYIGGAILSIVVALYFDYRSYSIHISKNALKRLLKFSLPLVPSSAAVFLTIFVDRIVIKEYMGLHDLGLFSVAAKFASVISLVITGFNSALAPLIYQEYKNRETPDRLSEMMTIYFFMGFTLICFFSLFSYEMLRFLTEESYYAAAPFIAALTLNMVTASAYIFGPGLSLAEKTKTIAGINIFIGIVNLMFNLVAVPLFGIFGAIVATFVASVLSFVLNIKLSQKHYGIPFSTTRIVLFFVLSCAAIALGIQLQADFSIKWIAIKVILGIAMVLIGAFTILSRQTLQKILAGLRAGSITKPF